MDVLYFIKEEYAYIKEMISDVTLSDSEHQLMLGGVQLLLKRMNLVVRIADELILPELAEASPKKVDALAEAGTLSMSLAKLLETPLKTGRIGESRRKDIFVKMSNHISVMEQTVLPIFRDEISTVAREELGLVAQDFKMDICQEPDAVDHDRAIGAAL